MNKIYLLLTAILFVTGYKSQNEDFESSAAGVLTTSSQVTGWSVTSGTNLNSCNISTCCPAQPFKSAIISAPNGFIDPMIGSGYMITSVYGSTQPSGFHGMNVLRLGNSSAGAKIEKVSKTFVVTNSNTQLDVAFLPVLTDGMHACCDQGSVRTLIKANSTVLADFSLSSSTLCSVNTTVNLQPTLGSNLYHPWMTQVIDFTPYMGQTVTIEFWSVDCVQGGHFAYTYLDAQSTEMVLTVNGASVAASSQSVNVNTCASPAILSAPSGFTSYLWTGPSGTYTTQAINTSQAGTYSLVLGQGSSFSTKVINLSFSGANFPLSTSVPILCPGNSSTITASGLTSYTWNTGANTPFIVVNPTVTTTYVVNGHDAQGCSGSRTITQIVSNTGNVSVNSSNPVSCPWEAVTLGVTGVASQMWDNSMITPTILVTPSVTTTYTVVGANLNGCLVTRTIVQTVDPCTAINTNGSLPDGISLYPNPNQGEFVLNVETAKVPMQFILSDVTGREFFSCEIKKGENTIRIPERAPGVYFYRVSGREQVVSGKLYVR